MLCMYWRYVSSYYLRKCTICCVCWILSHDNIWCNAKMSAESLIDPIFFELVVMNWFYLEWFNRRDPSWRWWDSNWSYSKPHNFCAQNVQLQNYSRDQHFWKCCCLQGFHFHVFMRYIITCSCRRDTTPLWWNWRCQISPVWYW